ncbi:hypothetical protein KI387_014600 [Taxus chinensis]|uniref:Potassium transporter n=1 Tax=Taxus chinensis TaxID=29808 RepID=A0AA38CNC8_TAXCH|nr:hypothetical protein KI387_014600 [Taxus chinensis]
MDNSAEKAIPLESIEVQDDGPDPQPKAPLLKQTISQAYLVPHAKPKIFGKFETLLLAYQTLGVVYGDLGTSPLYTFSSISIQNPGEKDLLGILSMVFWTLTMIALIKYVFIVIRADDHGEVLSAVQGIQSKGNLSQGAVVGVSAAILLVLFLLQRFGTEGWVLLGGVVLCITGAEAMFADLGHFNKRSIQIAYSALVYPALIITYTGQTAYLIKNPGDMKNAFYSSIPDPVYWPMFVIATLAAIVASQALISASFSIIKQSMALGCFPRVKIVHTSQTNEGRIYSPEVNYVLMVICLAIVVGFRGGPEIGNAYDRSSINIYKRGKLSTEELHTLVASVGSRVPGVCFLCSDLVYGLPPILRHYVKSVGSLHEILIILTIRTVPVNTVLLEERFLVGKLGPNGVYRCLAQYGYRDVAPNMEEQEFLKQVIESIKEHIRNEEVRDSPDDHDGNSVAENSYSAATLDELQQIEFARNVGAVYVLGNTTLRTGKKRGLVSGWVIGFYGFLQTNCRSTMSTLRIPPTQLLQVGMVYEL